MPAPLVLTFVSTVAFAIQLLIFAYLYSSHRVRFFQYLLVSWGAYTLSKGLKVIARSPRWPSRWPPRSRTGGTIGSAGGTSCSAPAPRS
ncbi:MAG: hypothetical protein DME05_00030 [Candidatus Rokuibacteriota bacterium]|nr:MAG: hypothetical protein DME05_00030 [Candidatus Rokubacteria bacterium]